VSATSFVGTRLVVSDASLFVGREEGAKRGSFLSSCDTADLINRRATVLESTYSHSSINQLNFADFSFKS